MDVFTALSDPVRRDLLVAVSGNPMRVVDLTAEQVITRPAVSRHLRLLVEAGLVDVENRGRERHYTLCPQALAQVQQFIDLLRRNTVPGPLSTNALHALDTEVRRTSRERRTAGISPTEGRARSTPASREDSA